ncbi:MAG: hypothetical protein WC729_07630 [Sphingomonas sp.]|jgi:hypothetical protein|uniref:hypothetical protein n=1 Tax=Sphingomonas sp. TaxID=28214 RepID=UPI00356A2FB4
MFRSWQGCFVLTGIVFVLQLFPYTGIFLMMLAAPYWSVLLINLAFALMIRDSWTGAQPRWLMLFPALWFGGYFCVAAVSHWQAHNFNATIVAANAHKHISFDQKKYDILIEPDHRDSSNGSSLTPDVMVKWFGVTRAYQVIGPSPGDIQGYELTATQCPGTMGAGAAGGGTWQRLIDGGYGTGRKMTFARNLCLFISPSKPQRPTIRIRPQPQVESKGLTTRASQDIVVATPDGRAIVLRSGWADPLSWIPQPVMGCWLNSGQPAWQCDASFLHEKLYDRKRDRTPNGADDVVGRALGLVKTSVRERYLGVEWR